MATRSPSSRRVRNERPSSEINELRLRLEEAEQALEAIRTGQAESLVVEGPDGPRIFSLESADHSYRMLVEAMNEGATTLAEDGTILYCNSRFAEMVDAPLEQVMGSAILRFLPHRSRETFEALVRDANEGASRGELELLGQRGQVVPAYLSISVIRDGGSNRLCVVATDLRAQKHNEEIVAAEGLARSVLEQAAEAIVVCDEQGRIIRASRTAAEICGGNPLLRPFDAVFVLELSPEAGHLANPREFHERGVAGAALRGAVAFGAPATLSRPDGSKAQVLVSATALRGAHDRVQGCVVSLVDVSDFKRATQALRESEERLRRAQQIAHLGSWEQDHVDGDLSWSEEVYRIFGLEPRAVTPSYEAFLEAVHPDDRAAVGAAYSGSLRDARDGHEIEHRVVRRASGEIRTVHERWEHIRDGSGRILRTVGMVLDITERKRAEEARAANLELADADRRKNQFLAMLSHELRNPLAPIRNSTRVLERAAPGSAQARRALAVIDRQAAQLSRLVDDLLDVTRITRDKIQLQRQIVDLNELVQRALDDQRSLFEGAGVQLELHPAPGPVLVSADWNRLTQVIDNLLQNAVKFTDRGGATRVTIHADPSESQAAVHVADTGVGMAPDMVSRLFQPFSQADSTLDRSKGGLGLGLALVKGLVELHGGRVSAHSEGRGKGAEFVVRLPLAGVEAVAPPPGDGLAGGCRRVLVIDDNVDAADSLCELLELDDYVVEVAYDGSAGIAKAREFRPDVVVCDIGLPGMDGYQVARAFRADEALRATYLVALSGYALPEDLQQAREAGFDRHAAKPLNLEHLVGVLSEAPQRSTGANHTAREVPRSVHAATSSSPPRPAGEPHLSSPTASIQADSSREPIAPSSLVKATASSSGPRQVHRRRGPPAAPQRPR